MCLLGSDVVVKTKNMKLILIDPDNFIILRSEGNLIFGEMLRDEKEKDPSENYLLEKEYATSEISKSEVKILINNFIEKNL